MKRFKIISVLICLLSVIPCMGATIIVDANTANPSADFNNIKDAISSPTTTDDDIIVVNPGIYTGADNRDLDFLGKAITLMSTNPNDPDIVATTIINCENLGRGFLFFSGEDANSIVDGFTITNGKGDLGGGMQIVNSSPTVRNCIFSGNIGNYVGGGIYCNQSSPTVKNCIFIGNSSAHGGAGMYNYTNSSPNVSNCNFINNSAYTNQTGVCSGGGIHNRSDSSPTITNCKFIGNTAKQDGGGIYNQTSSHPNVTNCTFINNSGRGGGGIYNNGCNPKIVNCTFSKNRTNLYNPGGAICNSASSPEIVNCIIWDNKGTSPSEIYPTTLLTVSYCDVKGGYPGGTNIINLDPLFVDPDVNDYHLQPDSPCIDAGDPCGVYAGQTDIDGEPRVFGNYVDMGSDEACPNIEATPVEYDFGDVEVGTSAMTIVTISNLGNAGLGVNSLGFTAGSSNDFSITASPNIPAVIEPNEFVDVEITYSPSVEGYVAAVLEVASDDPDESVEQIALGGAGVITEIPPSQQVVDILAFIDTSLELQTLAGAGPGKSGEGRLGALINMIEAAGDLIEAELFEESCQQLHDAYRRTDGEPRPPDFVSGEASAELAEMIQNLRLSLECE